MHSKKHESCALWSRRRILLTVLITIFAVETGAMFVLPVLLPSDVRPWVEAVCDATLLSVASLPVLWLFLIRPMHAAVLSASHRARLLMAALDEHALVSITDTRGRIVHANESFCRVSQYTREELLGRDHRIVNSGHHPSSFMKNLWDTIQRGDTWHGEVKNRAKDGSFYWVNATIVPFTNADGRIENYVAIRTDITEEKCWGLRLKQSAVELERQREELAAQNRKIAAINETLEEAYKKAEEATRAKSEFLANMSHEIRTPMTAILGYTETLLDPGISESERLNAVHTVHRNGEHLLQIINDILDISKIEAGKIDVERLPCPLVPLIADVHSLMHVRAEAQRLAFNVEYIGPVPESIVTDPTRLRQILLNLIGNAIKFTESGGVRLIIRFVGDGDEPYMQFDVLDSGIGMTAEQVGKLFQAFTQADTSTTRKFGGTGLGLMISKRLAEMLGGTITVTSAPGEGSLFRLTVVTGPLDDVAMINDPATATVAKPESASPLAGDVGELDCRILLAEDGLDNQRLIAHVLKRAGAEVTIVGNGKLAVDAAMAGVGAGAPFDVVLMDMQMPVMDGYEAAGQLRLKGYRGAIVALTAHAMAGDRQKCIDAGCDDYATKPIDRRKLIATIQKYVHGEDRTAGASKDRTEDQSDGRDVDPQGPGSAETVAAELAEKLADLESALTAGSVGDLAELAKQIAEAAGRCAVPAITEAAGQLESAVRGNDGVDALNRRIEKLASLCRRGLEPSASKETSSVRGR